MQSAKPTVARRRGATGRQTTLGEPHLVRGSVKECPSNDDGTHPPCPALAIGVTFRPAEHARTKNTRMKLFSSLFRRKEINPIVVGHHVFRVISAELGALSAYREKIVNAPDSSERSENKAILDSYDELRVLAICAARHGIMACAGIEEPIRRQICSVVDKSLSEVCADLVNRKDFDEKDRRYYQVFFECKDSLFSGDGTFNSRLAFVFEQFCRGGGAPGGPIIWGGSFGVGRGVLAIHTWSNVFFKTDEILRRQATKLKPDDPEGWGSLGLSYGLQGKHEDAAAAFRQAIKLKPDDPKAWFNLGLACGKQAKESEARDALDHLRKLDPSKANELADLLSAKQATATEKAPADPRSQPDTGTAPRPTSPAGSDSAGGSSDEFAILHSEQFRRVGAAEEANDPVGMLNAAEDLTRKFPDHCVAWTCLGSAYALLQKHDNAIAAFRHAIKLKPSYPGAWFSLGEAYRSQGKLDDAIAAFHEAIKLYPDIPQAWLGLGTAYGQQGKLDDAIAACRQAVKLKPEYPDAWNTLGLCYRDQGNYNDAVPAFRQAIKLKPNDSKAWLGLGNIYIKQGKHDDAVTAFRQAIKLKPDDPDAWYNLASACGDQGKYDDAVAACQQAVKLKPDDSQAWGNLGFFYQNQGKYDDAVTAFREAVRLQPDYFGAWHRLGGVLYWDQGNYNDAVAAYRQAIKLKPNDSKAWLGLGLSYAAQGKRSEALDALDHLRKLDPSQADKLADLLSSK
jgi:tetratricopeptide (TPR) repeat protein